MGLEQLNEILKRGSVSEDFKKNEEEWQRRRIRDVLWKDVKLLAIQRYLETPKND